MVKVYVAGEPVGAITRSDVEAETFLFTYRPECATSDAVSLTMPVVSDQYDAMGTIHPIFEMNLPEGALRKKLELMFSKVIRNFDSLSLLEIVGKSQLGRLRFANDDLVPDDIPAQSVKTLLGYSGAEDLFSDLLERFALHSGISGMQPKVLIRDDNAPLDRFTSKGATHIVKSFNPKEYLELAANEYFCMCAARYANIPTANVQLSKNRQLLIVDRFDRTDAGQFFGFEDFCVLSGMRSDGRYHSSYERLADLIRAYVSPEHHATAMQTYFAMVVLSCAIKNGDAHLKNFGILYDRYGENVRLAPAYDVLSTIPYHPRDVLALELCGSKAFPTPDKLRQFGRQACGLTSRQVTVIFGNVARGVRQAMSEISAFTERNRDFTEASQYFLKIFEDGQTQLNMEIAAP